MATNNDLNLLEEIINNLKKFIEDYYIIYPKPSNPSDPTYVTPMIPGRFHEEFLNAWNEVSVRFAEVINTIKNNPPEDLGKHGLSGAQLLLKYKFCKEALDRAKDWYTREKMDEKPKDKPWYKKWFSYCKHFFHSSNIVVDSLSKDIPFAGSIKEMIDGVVFLSEIGVDYAD